MKFLGTKRRLLYLEWMNSIETGYSDLGEGAKEQVTGLSRKKSGVLIKDH